MKICMVVAAHKPYRMPEDKMYLPLHVGAEGKAPIGFQPDSTGDNISAKNANYCELTGLYWAWKHVHADAIGLVHYRRHFASGCPLGDKWSRVITKRALIRQLDRAPVLLPSPRHYWIETNYSHYVHAHHAEDLDITREILAEQYPEYLPAWDHVMRKTSGHRFNMFVMRRDWFDRWCEFLFPVLFELEKRLDIRSYSAYDARVFGFVGERLLDVWLEANHVPYADLPYVFMEQQNWLQKGWNFTKRKFMHK